MSYNAGLHVQHALGATRRFKDAHLYGAQHFQSFVPEDAFKDWEREARLAGRFTQGLADTDAYVSALLSAQLRMIFGDGGLRFLSDYQMDAETSTSSRERFLQKQINREVKAASRRFNLDAGAQLTRTQTEKLIQLSKAIHGDGWAVRVFNPRRPRAYTGSAWRVIAPDRICNPEQVGNWERPQYRDPKTRRVIVTAPAGHVIWEGIELDEDRIPAAVWIRSIREGHREFRFRWERIPWRADDGTPNVIHRFDPMVAGQIRGFPDLTPVYMTALQLKFTSEAHMIGKRTMACHPIGVSTSDPDIAGAFERSGAVFGPHTRITPGMFAYLGADGQFTTPNWSYQGSDFAEFVRTSVQAIAASRGIPWQYVMMHVEGISMASGRIFLDMAEAVAKDMQDTHIAQVTGVMDEVILREAIARQRIPISSIENATAGTYLRPRQASLDKLKEGKAAETWLALGKSPTRIFADAGLDFHDETLQRKQDLEFLASEGLQIAPVGSTAKGEQEDDEEDEEDEEQDQ